LPFVGRWTTRIGGASLCSVHRFAHGFRRSGIGLADAVGVELFDRVVLIYNPMNRRVPLTLAELMWRELDSRLPDVPVVLVATGHAGHARELASAAAATGRPLIVAVSGDGVYNEVVNGVLDVSGNEALAAVAAAGNANDHRRSTRRMPLVDAIVAAHITGRARHLDLLRLTVRSADSEWSQYAHSYIGFGLTPLMAVGLKRDRKGTIAELFSVLRTFTELTPVEIVRSEGRRELYDSLVFANVARMAKYGRLSRFGRPDDGLFEVVSRRHGRRWQIAAMALRAVTIGLGAQAHVSRVEFTTVNAVPAQIDGEVLQLESDSGLTIDCVPHALNTVG
jgi:diacylglycerol kinase (ATP)